MHRTGRGPYIEVTYKYIMFMKHVRFYTSLLPSAVVEADTVDTVASAKQGTCKHQRQENISHHSLDQTQTKSFFHVTLKSCRRYHHCSHLKGLFDTNVQEESIQPT